MTNLLYLDRKECWDKFQKLGFTSITPEQIIPATYAMAKYLVCELPHVTEVLVIGSSGMCRELELHGLTVHTSFPDITNEATFAQLEVNPTIGAVVVGYDFTWTYSKLAYASLCIQHNNCPLLVTSRDAFDQLKDRRIPGMTALVNGLEACTGKEATVVGKPSKWLIDHLISTHELNPKRTCMIGDRLDSDMVFGHNGKLTKVLVLTGCTSASQVEALKESESPTYPHILLSSLASLEGK